MTRTPSTMLRMVPLPRVAGEDVGLAPHHFAVRFEATRLSQRSAS